MSAQTKDALGHRFTLKIRYTRHRLSISGTVKDIQKGLEQKNRFYGNFDLPLLTSEPWNYA